MKTPCNALCITGSFYSNVNSTNLLSIIYFPDIYFQLKGMQGVVSR